VLSTYRYKTNLMDNFERDYTFYYHFMKALSNILYNVHSLLEQDKFSTSEESSRIASITSSVRSIA